MLASVLLGRFALRLCPAAAQDAAEIMLRLDRLEAENRRLTGQVDEMRFQIRRLEDQLKRFQTDADLRFRDLEQGRPGARPQAPAAQHAFPHRKSHHASSQPLGRMRLTPRKSGCPRRTASTDTGSRLPLALYRPARVVELRRRIDGTAPVSLARVAMPARRQTLNSPEP